MRLPHETSGHRAADGHDDGSISRARARRGRSPGLPAMGLNVAPMIDVVFLLLMYFLLIAEFKRPEESMSLSIARAGAGMVADPFALPEAPITIRVESFGQGRGEARWSADSAMIGSGASFDMLTRAAAEKRGSVLSPEQRFDIEPAAGCRWEHAVEAVNAIRLARFSQVRLAEAAP